MPGRIFPKLSPFLNQGIDHSYYTSSNKLVEKFRLFDKIEVSNSSNNIADYLTMYTTNPATEEEILKNL